MILAEIEARLDERRYQDECGCYQKMGEPPHVCKRCAELLALLEELRKTPDDWRERWEDGGPKQTMRDFCKDWDLKIW